MLLQSIFKFGPTDQICAKTPKFETPILLFLRTHACRLLMAYPNCFFPQIFNQVKKGFALFIRLHDSYLMLLNAPTLYQ